MAFTYDGTTKREALRLLKTSSITEVADATGVGAGTLKQWARAAGITPPDGRRKTKAERPGKKRQRGKTVQQQRPARGSVEACLAEIERAGKAIAAVRTAYRKAMGL
jgi:hypothetical protein